jgi:hypothetical protein
MFLTWPGCWASSYWRWPLTFYIYLRRPDPHVRGCWAVDQVLGKE